MNVERRLCQTLPVHWCVGVVDVLDGIGTWTLVREHGRWDPELDAYEVTDPKTGDLRYFVWTKPGMMIDAVAVTLMVMFWIGVGSFVFLLFFHYPSGVAGETRKEQLADVLRARYNITTTWLPELWTPTQVFTIDVEQGWDDPTYEREPLKGTGCKLQPGANSKELSLECPDTFGELADLRLGGADAQHDREWRQRVADEFNVPEPDGTVDEFFDDLESKQFDYNPQYDDYYDPYYDYEPPAPEEMYP